MSPTDISGSEIRPTVHRYIQKKLHTKQAERIALDKDMKEGTDLQTALRQTIQQHFLGSF